ncbi:MAG: AMP-binding protein [Elusimicrobia bacterium]|nr:AMP-binding protein [Elusimicrobiota bacterium]
MNVAEALSEQARLRPDAPAVIDRARGQDRVTTFGELETTARRAAAMLGDSGLERGDAVLVFQPMSAELYAALVAILRQGLVGMFVDPARGVAHIEDCCGVLPPQAFIGSGRAHLLRLLSPALRRIPRKFSTGLPLPGARSWRGLRRFPEAGAAAEAAADAPALVTFTSGTGGRPKAVVRTHGFLDAQRRVIAETLTHRAGEVELTSLPIFVLANLASGLTSVIPHADLRRPDAIDPRPVLRQIDRFRPSRCVAPPAFLARLADGCARRGRSLGTLERVYTGGGPVFPRLLRDVARIAPSVEVVAVYGSTEAEPIARTTRAELDDADVAAMRGGAGILAGAPVPGLEVRILPDRWGTPLPPMTRAALEAQALPPGGAGEIVVAGEHVLTGYLGGVGDSESKFRVDGHVWHRTGDAGRFDARGRLWLLGRCESKIADARGVLYPFAVECASLEFAYVRRAALDALDGLRVLAVEPAGRGLSPAQSRELARALAWAGVDEVRAIRRIPLDPRHNSKVDYAALRRRLSSSRSV